MLETRYTDRDESLRPEARAGGGMRTVGLFAGVGGLERGLHLAGHTTEFLCEIDDGAQDVLREHFQDVPLEPDIKHLVSLPEVDLVAAGFPCQDLSMAGRKEGIGGTNSSLVENLFRLLQPPGGTRARWLLLENVPYMLHLDRGRAMTLLTTRLEDLGFRWAYRVVDARAFGVPQRRLRVVLLASRTEDPREVLFVDDINEPPVDDSFGPIDEDMAYGFYWTEGKRGVGWAPDAVPTVKGGSSLGIPSPPAVWVPRRSMIGTPDVRDAERLQGFPADWTLPATREGNARKGVRWRLVGNAVCTPVARWIGERLRDPGVYAGAGEEVPTNGRWPRAAWGGGGKVYRVPVSTWPVRYEYEHLLDFLEFPLVPLSARATQGFLNRALVSEHIKYPKVFLDAVAAHLETTRQVGP